MVALDAAGMKVAEIVDDAVRQNQALDAYDACCRSSSTSSPKRTRSRIVGCFEEEIARRVAELHAINDDAKKVAAEQHEFQAWQTRKRQEEDRHRGR